MSWFRGGPSNTQALEDKISEATSESIPNGEIDISIAFEITDIIRSKKFPPKQCMRCLKKRLAQTYQNPNLLTSTLKLTDLCVKNGGYHFLVELSTKEFMDYLIDFIFLANYNVNDYKIYTDQNKLDVGTLILTLIKNWSIFFHNQIQLNYVEKCYKDLMSKGFQFPETDTSDYNENFIDTEAPADWVDNDECMICYKPFSVMNRKHHCRSCGGVFCQEHSAKTAALPHLGIMEPVRVCDNCHFKLKYKLNDNSNLALKNNSKHKAKSKSTSSTGAADGEEDEDLKKAIELSLKESGGIEAVGPPPEPPQPIAPSTDNNNNGEEEEDEEMKAAIAASLKEFEQQEKLYKAQQPPQPEPQTHQPPAEAESQSEFYNNILPFGQGQEPIQPQTGSQVMTPTAHMEKHTKTEDLTQKEEESVNLYITLINQIKTDKVRQLNLLYDKDLNDLHSQIIQIKPKLNKTLRSAIENYESFVALNNKLSTITKLYDQFLESKLSQAYGNHTIYSPYPTDQNNPPAGAPIQPPTEGMYQYPTQSPPPQGYAPQFTGPQHTGQQYHRQPQYREQYGGEQFAAPNHTGPAGNFPATQEPQYTGQESEPNYGESEPNYGESEPNYGQSELNGPQTTGGGYPVYGNYPSELEPSYGKEFNHMSAYPPVEDLGSPQYNYPQPPQTQLPQAPPVANGTGNSVESTRSRYPPIDEVNSLYLMESQQPSNSQPLESHPNNSQPRFETSAGRVPAMPQVPSTSFNQEPEQTEPKRTEEPLIEL